MKSATKYKVEQSLLEHITKNAFGVKPISVQAIDDGSFNAVYLIEVPDGRRAVLKVAPCDDERVLRYEKNIMYTEVSVMQKIKRHTAVPVPDLYYFDAAHTSCPSDYFFMQYINASNYHLVETQLSEDVRNRIDEQIGMYNRYINEIKGHLFGYFGQERRQKETWYEAFSRMLEDIIADAKHYNVEFGLDENVFYRLLESDEEAFNAVTEPRLVHSDLWAGNVFIREDKIVAIIDWERCLWADPLIERGFRSEHLKQSFLRGYQREEPFTAQERRRLRWYDLYYYMTLAVEECAREYDDAEYHDHVWKQYHQALSRLKLD
ncbi:MAG: aminoglycoside phosphotransferase family protein [Lachnospiraceae bacterium]|nr:aminoglycoside phosphotransferase family protein [Lachnospiraceae bacterium]